MSTSEFRLRQDETLLLTELLDELAGPTGAGQAAHRLVRLVSRLVRCQSVVLLDSQVLAAQGPHVEAVEAQGLLGIEDEQLREARVERRESVREQAGSSLFPDETAAVALPVGDDLVLYVGRPERAFDDDERERLRLAALHAGRYLAVAARLEAEREAREAYARLGGWVESLVRLLDGLRALSANLDVGSLLDHLGTRLPELVPCDSALFIAGSDFRWLIDPGSEPHPGLWELVARTLEGGRTLLVDDLARTRFPPLAPGEKSLLVAPIREQQGALLAGSRTPFTRDQMQLVSLLASQLGSLLEVVQAYERLQASEAQLVQSSKLAAVGQLAAGVAHEINNPLGTIRLAVDSVLKLGQTKPELTRPLLENARKAAERARVIVEKLLYYSREARVGMQPTELGTLVTDTLELMAHQLQIDGVEVLRSGPTEPVWVRCNQNEVQQVVTNLVLNARDAVLSGDFPRRLEVAVRAEGDEAVVEVTDDGPGVPDEVGSRIFDPFFTTKPVGKGTGLGLSVSRQIAEAHRGRLELAGPSTFQLRLPKTKAEE